jgi:O-antigen/teichoic acid export membrane protein
LGIVQRDGFKLTVVSYFGLILGYISRVLLFPNILDTDQVGLTNILISLSLIYAQLSAMGLWSITLRFFPFFNNREKQHHGFLFWATVLMIVGFLITTCGFLLLKPLVVKHYSEHAKLFVDYYYYLIPLGLATVFFQIYDSYLRSLLKTVVPSFINEVMLRVLIIFSICLYAFHIVDFHRFVQIYVALNCSVALIILAYTAYVKQLFLTPSFTPKVRRFSGHMLRFGTISIFSTAGNALLATIDILMITTLMGSGVVDGVKVDALYYVGIYSTVFFFTTVMLIPYRSILKITSPMIALYWKKRDMKSMESLYKQVTSVLLVLGLLLFVGIWANFDNIVSFMPAQFAKGKYVFLFVSLGRFFDMSTGLNGAITLTSKKYRYDLAFTAFLIVLTIVLNYLFIQTYGMGINGAAIATMISVITYNVLRLIFVKYFFRMQPFTKGNAWVLLLGIACFGLNYILPFFWNRYADMAIRSTLITILFMGPVILLKLCPEVNSFLIKFLKPFGIQLKFLED